MKKWKLTLIQFISGVTGLLSSLLHFYFYEKFLSEGSVEINQTHAVVLNEHGSKIYITSSQDHLLVCVSVIQIVSIAIFLVANFSTVQSMLARKS